MSFRWPLVRRSTLEAALRLAESWKRASDATHDVFQSKDARIGELEAANRGLMASLDRAWDDAGRLNDQVGFLSAVAGRIVGVNSPHPLLPEDTSVIVVTRHAVIVVQ